MQDQHNRPGALTERDTKSRRTQVRRFRKDVWKSHTRKIAMGCFLVTVPMLVFTIVLIWIVLAHSLDQASCPYSDLCPGTDLINATTGSDYYVDVPAGQLTFIASWSSTISFILIGPLMTLFAYSTARQLQNYTQSEDSLKLLPSPYQTSLLIRVLNAEQLPLWDIFTQKFKGIFWYKEQSDKTENLKFPPMLLVTIAVFVVCLLVSILIQAADSYLHISVQAVNFVEIHPQQIQDHLYSRGLSQWCLDRESVGSTNNKNYWSCGITFEEEDTGVIINNKSEIFATWLSKSKLHKILDYTDEDRVQYAFVGPSAVAADTDYIGSTFGVSTQCAAIPYTMCDVYNRTEESDGTRLDLFRCDEAIGLSLSGTIDTTQTQDHYVDFHKYIQETDYFHAPLYSSGKYDIYKEPDIPKLTDEDADSVFRNPWKHIIVPKLPQDKIQSAKSWENDSRLWILPESGTLDYLFMLNCNDTVWEINYGAVGSEIIWMEPKKSNGSIAGIASMVGRPYNNLVTNVISEFSAATSDFSSPDDYIQAVELANSRGLSFALAGQSSPRPALKVQKRESKVISKLPVFALWFLVASNFLFTLLGLGLTLLAFASASPSIHQIQVRLGIAGLVAELVEKPYSERAVLSDSDLFEENAKENRKTHKRFGLVTTELGGSRIVVNTNERPMVNTNERPMVNMEEKPGVNAGEKLMVNTNEKPMVRIDGRKALIAQTEQL